MSSDEYGTRKWVTYYSARIPEYCFERSQTLPAPGLIARLSDYWVQALPYHDAHCTCWATQATKHKQGVEMASCCAANTALTVGSLTNSSKEWIIMSIGDDFFRKKSR